MDREQAASRRLERLAWRTTRRENPADFEQKDTARKWGAVLTAVINYQNKHHGLSPTDLMISKDTQLSPGQVQYHLREMEKHGLVADSKGWPRVITVTNVAKVQGLSQLTRLHIAAVAKEEKVKEAKTMDTTELQKATARKAKTYGPTGRQPFMVRARAIAQAVIDHYDTYGHSPDAMYIKECVYGRRVDGGGLSRVVSMMVALGWLHHENGRHRDYALTGLGRAALFGQLEEQLHTDNLVNPPEDLSAKRSRAGALGAEARWAKEREKKALSQPSQLPPLVEVRRATAPNVPGVPISGEQSPVMANNAPALDIKMLADVDLVIELTNRGFKVSR